MGCYQGLSWRRCGKGANILQEDDSNAAEELGLTGDRPQAEEQLMLIQMPSVLPATAHSSAASQGGGGLRQPTSGPAGPPAAVSLRDLPAGKVCKSVEHMQCGHAARAGRCASACLLQNLVPCCPTLCPCACLYQDGLQNI